jgi:hypothetical protein
LDNWLLSQRLLNLNLLLLLLLMLRLRKGHGASTLNLVSPFRREDAVTVVNEAASGTVWAGAQSMECTTDLSLVLGVTRHWTEFFRTMSELALGAISTCSGLGPGSAQLCLVQ